ncbi:MAG: hypothetical protein WC539_03300 [Nitrospirota bacterium]
MKKNIFHILYHIAIIALSAGIAFSLPGTLKYVTQKLLLYWSFIENERFFLIVAEITIAVLLIVLLNMLTKVLKMRRRSHMAKKTGLVATAAATSPLARKQIKRIKEQEGRGRSVLIIGSTGYQSFVDQEGDLHQVLKNCREAKIMLLHPHGDGATIRAKSLDDPSITTESFQSQIMQSIDFLKTLRESQKKIRLKLYRDTPLLKMAIMGDYLCLQHYPTGLHIKKMPEYVFKHQETGLFNLFYQYFITRWFDAAVPEYELDTDKLVYRDRKGNIVKYEQLRPLSVETLSGKYSHAGAFKAL